MRRESFTIALATGCCGGAVALAIQMSDGGFGKDPGFLRVAFAGAFLAGLAMARCFGRPGGSGALFALLGYIAATTLGALAAWFLLPLEGGLANGFRLTGMPDAEFITASPIAPIYVLGCVLDEPLVGATWTGAGALLHLAARRLKGTARRQVLEISL